MAGSRAVLNAETAKELGITDAQRTKIQDLTRKAGEASRSLMEKVRNQELEMSEVRERNQKNNVILDTEIAKILTDAQKTKLMEISGPKFDRKDPQ